MDGVIQKPTTGKFVSNIYILSHTKDSLWIKEGTGGDTGTPAQKMHTCNIMFLPVTSQLYLGKDKGYMPTMYVVGANTHYVEDYWEDKSGKAFFDKISREEGKELGYEYRPGLRAIYGEEKLRKEEANSKRLGIHFKNGQLILSTYGDYPVLRRFVNEHEQNNMAPNAAENRNPQRLKLFMFEPLVKESKAAKGKVVEQWDDNVSAILFVDKLRTKTAGGYEYNEAALDAVISIIQEGGALAQGEVNQKFEIAAKAAKVDGALFMSMVNSEMSDYRMEIGKATDLNVLEYTATQAKLLVDDKKVILTTFKNGTKKEDVLDELVFYFLGDAKGKSDFKELKRASETAKIKALSK